MPFIRSRRETTLNMTALETSDWNPCEKLVSARAAPSYPDTHIGDRWQISQARETQVVANAHMAFSKNRLGL